MGNVIMSGIVPLLEKPVGGTPIADVAVGSTLKLNVNGVAKDFLVVHQGKPSSMYDASCDGVWLLMKDIYENRASDSANNDYANSDIHAYLNGMFLGMFDADIRSVIKQIKIPYYNSYAGNGSTDTGANGLSTKIFFLSCPEVGFYQNYNHQSDGYPLKYFEGTNYNGSDSKRSAYLNGTASVWQLRTGSDSRVYVSIIQANGAMGQMNVTSSSGVRPALILPSDALLSEDGTIIV